MGSFARARCRCLDLVRGGLAKLVRERTMGIQPVTRPKARILLIGYIQDSPVFS
jgi:hypothetical protein